MMLRAEELEVLERLGFVYRVEQHGGVTHILISGYQLPVGLGSSTTNLLIQIPVGFPDVRPDMFWCQPAVNKTSGVPPGTSAQVIGAVSWQRWSRHIGSAWRPGIDDLETYLAYIRRCFLLEASQTKTAVPA